jgi:hypothetical protein
LRKDFSKVWWSVSEHLGVEDYITYVNGIQSG